MQNSESMLESFKAYLDKKALIMLLLGFSAGIPILLIFSSLSLWLREAGVSRSAVTYFSWAALGYSFKFVWAPLVDKLPIPLLTKSFGRRRSWLLTSQIMVILSIVSMALIDPSVNGNLTYMAIAAVALGFSSATQDIIIDAFRIESANARMQAILASTYIGGYRLAMIVSGAGSLFIAEYLGSTGESYLYSAWMKTYFVMAACMLLGVITTFFISEPEVKIKSKEYSTKDYFIFFTLFLVVAAVFITGFNLTSPLISDLKKSLIGILGNKALAGFISSSAQLGLSILMAALSIFIIDKANIVNTEMIRAGYLAPIKNFFDRYGKNTAILLLMLIGFYRVSDIVLGVISNVFYQDLKFTKTEIGTVVKTFGVIMSLLGGFIGGAFTNRYGVMKMLMWGAILAAGTNLLFLLLATVGKDQTMLYFVISADNLAAGLASAAFVAFLSGLTDISFTAVQYAIFTSLMTLFPKILGGYSGGIVDSIGYEGFFIFTTLIGVPIIALVHICSKKFKVN